MKRFSCLTNDEGYDAWMRAQARGSVVTVHLNGKKLTHVFTADEVLGEVVIADLDEKGSMQLNLARDDVLKKTLRGDVMIELTGEHERPAEGTSVRWKGYTSPIKDS